MFEWRQEMKQDLHNRQRILTAYSPDPVLTVQVVLPLHHDADGTPWWPKLTLLYYKYIPKVPGMLCQNFIESDQAVMEIHYMTGF